MGISNSEKESPESFILQQLVNVKMYNPMTDGEPNLVKEAQNYFEIFGIWDRLQEISKITGPELYNSRFLTDFAWLVFACVGLSTSENFPEKSDLHRRVIDWLYRMGNDFVNLLEESWERKNEKYGVITPIRFHEHGGKSFFV